MSTQNKSFLGTGWDFPPAFSQIEGQVKMVSAEADIQSSLEILLTTTQGERVLRPDFGTNLKDLIFDPLDLSLKSLLESRIKDLIYIHEPRVSPDAVTIAGDGRDGKVEVQIDYTIVSTNTRSNVVFPFYLGEGTDIPT